LVETDANVRIDNILYVYNQIQSPIYYDYTDTNYYTNQQSTSRYNALQVNKTYQSEQYIDVPGTFNGSARRWVRFSISRFNGGGSPVRISISRAIGDNSSKSLWWMYFYIYY